MNICLKRIPLDDYADLLGIFTAQIEQNPIFKRR